MGTKEIQLQYQGLADGTVTAFDVNGMLCIGHDENGVVYVTKQQAMEFFDLVPREKFVKLKELLSKHHSTISVMYKFFETISPLVLMKLKMQDALLDFVTAENP